MYMADWKGKRAVVVGGTSGIGLATAKLFLAGGAEVVAVGRDRRKVEALAGTGLLGVVADATVAADLDRLFSEVPAIDFLVLALSGGKGAGPFRSLALDELRSGIEAKLLAQLGALQAALPHLSADASITLVSAASAGAAIPGTAGLAALNAAIEATVPVLAVELAPVRVNAVSPGVVDTPWWDAMPVDMKKSFFARAEKTLPVGRVATPEDLAEVIALAATNRYMTGSVLRCDGGGSLVGG